MDNISKIKEAIEKALKSEPEILGNKNLVFFENKEVDWSKKDRKDVEVYLENAACDGTYHVHICGTEFVAMVDYYVKKFLQQSFNDPLINCEGTVEDDVIFITITE